MSTVDLARAPALLWRALRRTLTPPFGVLTAVSLFLAFVSTSTASDQIRDFDAFVSIVEMAVSIYLQSPSSWRRRKRSRWPAPTTGSRQP